MAPGGCLPLHRGYIHVYFHNPLKPLGQSKPNFMWSILRKRENKFILNGPGHMTKMAAMAIISKKHIRIFSSRTRWPVILKLVMKHQAVELYKVYINLDPWMTLTYFMIRSTYLAHAFEWGKLLQCHLKD